MDELILNELKKRLDSAKGLWFDELLAIGGAIGQLRKAPLGRSKVVLLVKVAIHIHQITTFQKDLNSNALNKALDLLPMVRGNAYLREGIAKVWMTRFYNHKVKERTIRERD